MQSMEFKDRFRKALEDSEIEQKTLASTMGVSVTALQFWLSGRNKPHRKRILRLAKELKVSAEWLEFGSSDSSPSEKEASRHAYRNRSGGSSFAEENSEWNSNAYSSAPLKKKPHRIIPVVGTTQGGPDRQWEELGYPTDWGDEFAAIESDDPHAYLLRVEGDSMSPRINEGDYVLMEPSTLAQPGDIVVARLTTGEVTLKYFRADYVDEIVLESHNPSFNLKIVKKSEVVSIHQVIGTLYRRKIKKRA